MGGKLRDQIGLAEPKRWVRVGEGEGNERDILMGVGISGLGRKLLPGKLPGIHVDNLS